MSRPDDRQIAAVDWYEMVVEHRENPNFDVQRLIDAGDALAKIVCGEGRMSTDRPIKTRAEFVSFVLASMNAIGDMISPREAGDAFVKALDEYERLESGDPGVAVAPPSQVVGYRAPVTCAPYCLACIAKHKPWDSALRTAPVYDTHETCIQCGKALRAMAPPPQDIYESVKASVRAEFHAIAEKNAELIAESRQLREGEPHDYYRDLINRLCQEITRLNVALRAVAPPQEPTPHWQFVVNEVASLLRLSDDEAVKRAYALLLPLLPWRAVVAPRDAKET